jgi:dCTP deaminase
MLLSAPAILRHMKRGTITIDPFNKKNLGNASYDVTLGAHYYREHAPAEGHAVFNPYNEDDTHRVWGKKHLTAEPLDAAQGKPPTPGIGPKDLVIWLAPGETILAHTQEFIGGTEVVDTMLKARSSTARNFISVCKCAGWGDVGYVNRWTMQIQNHSRYYHIPLVVGRRIAQMIFFEVEPLATGENAGAYHSKADSKYQATANLKKLKKLWKPGDMLPKMWKDRDVRR